MIVRECGRITRVFALAFVLACGLGAGECYKPIRRTGLPNRIKTIAVPAFQNDALRYRVETRFAAAVADEIIRRGRGLRVQSETEGADAVVDGVIKNFTFTGVLLSDIGRDRSARARVFEVTVVAAVTVRDQIENRVLYDNQNYVFRGEFEFANDPRTFFNEEDPAIARMSRLFAESLVSTVTNGFGVNDAP